ncbi:Ribosomal RNA-processing protein [Trema orientale]|uniref:Ribosomal RNA-processing protein n=1 Tax=Trema orientale TaxID=63057 RepID=A0A2P5BAN9_TREOI|nr:Ribosomal RNA-processing protein [Trema orientale]
MGTKDFSKKKRKSNQNTLKVEVLEQDRELNEAEIESKTNQSKEKKRKRKKQQSVDVGQAVQIPIQAVFLGSADNSIRIAKKKKGEKKGEKSPRKKKVKNVENNNALVGKSDQLDNETDDGFKEQHGRSKKALKKEKIQNSSKEGEKFLDKEETDRNKARHASSTDEPFLERKKGKSKEARKKKDHDSSKEVKSQEKEGGVNEDDVYLISSGDEDCSKGMKKWLTKYHESRPGLTILQERIDEFITAHEAQLEQERKEREAHAAEGGWTVVTHHKGRKKTTDAESGITVGSVAQAVAENTLAKKKTKEVGLDFYRFQRKEAQRNEIMMLQSKFEQDKKRIQQLRAARKFRPY